MTVLNPLRQIDERIMDDADMAGPIFFFFAFGVFLLLVRYFTTRSTLASVNGLPGYSRDVLNLATYTESLSSAQPRFTRFLTLCQRPVLTLTALRPFLDTVSCRWSVSVH